MVILTTYVGIQT